MTKPFSSLRWSLFALTTLVATVVELGLFGVSVGLDSHPETTVVLVTYADEQDLPTDWTKIPF